MPHDHAQHSHDHGHDHSHVSEGLSPQAITFAIVLNAIFVAAQVYYGVVAHSLALLADAGHNFGDLLGLILAGIAIWVAAFRPGKIYTFGLKSATILATLANTVLLLLTVFELVHASIEKLLEAPTTAPDSTIVILVALAAVVVNGYTAWLLNRGPAHDINIRGMYLHMLADAAVSVGVVLGAIVMHYTHALWLDSVISLVIAAAILWAAWNLLRRTLRLALQGIPTHISAPAVDTALRALPGVTNVHDLHIWALGTQHTALSAHLTIPTGHPGDTFFATAAAALEPLGITHPTLQIELSPHTDCGCTCDCSTPRDSR